MNSENDFENNDKQTGKKPLATELYFVIIIAVFVVVFAAAWLLDTEDDKAEIYYKAPEVTEADTEIFDSKQATTKVSIEVKQFPIDINLATVDQLCEINGIGEVIAQKIIDYRTEVGIIHDLKELEQISGIGESTIKLLTENVFVSNSDYIPFTTTIATTTKITTTAVKPQLRGRSQRLHRRNPKLPNLNPRTIRCVRCISTMQMLMKLPIV